MAEITPDSRDGKELIKRNFNTEAFNITQELEDLLYSAYLLGIDEGFDEGKIVGEDEGWDSGHHEGYDEGYNDATAEYETYD
jgi:hypothetical protein